MKILNALAPLLFIACLAAPAAAQTTPAALADVAGTWDATVTTAQGQTIQSQLKLKKDGEKIVGTISSQMGETPVEAQVKGKALTIWFNYQGQNGPMAVEMAGTVEGDTVKGTLAVAGTPGGDWTATRAKDPNAKDPPKEPAKDLPAAAKTDLTGTWNVSVELPSMTATPTLVLKQDGEKLTGDYVSAQYGKFAITGTIKGADVSLWFAMNVEGTALNVTFAGTVGKDGSLTGTVSYGDMMSGTFSASRKKQ
ncbi:MAG TPA: hypothetical protein VF921_04470 [Vicinamibacterales bacterium]